MTRIRARLVLACALIGLVVLAACAGSSPSSKEGSGRRDASAEGQSDSGRDSSGGSSTTAAGTTGSTGGKATGGSGSGGPESGGSGSSGTGGSTGTGSTGGGTGGGSGTGSGTTTPTTRAQVTVTNPPPTPTQPDPPNAPPPAEPANCGGSKTLRTAALGYDYGGGVTVAEILDLKLDSHVPGAGAVIVMTTNGGPTRLFATCGATWNLIDAGSGGFPCGKDGFTAEVLNYLEQACD